MENFFTRYKNPLVLMAVLVIQVIALATQIKRPENARAGATGATGPRLIRVWTVTAITPFEEALVATGHFFRNTWHNYIDLHDVRRKNRELQEEIDRLRLEQVRLRNDADQDRRLQSLLDFKDRYAGTIVAAQVIGSSGSEQSRVIYIDKGSRAGIRQDMAVITPDGIVGKVRDVYPFSSQVLLISDHDSGAGVILENSRLQGILRGKELGEIRVNDIMADETVAVGEHVITSGGDRVYPKGLPVGTVNYVGADPDAGPFHLITIKPAADLNRLEEVLVVTKMAEEGPPPLAGEPVRHAIQTLSAAPNKTDDKKPEENAASVASSTPLPPASSKPLPPSSAKPVTAGTGNATALASSTAGTGNAPHSGKPLTATNVTAPTPRAGATLAPSSKPSPTPQTASSSAAAEAPPALPQKTAPAQKRPVPKVSKPGVPAQSSPTAQPQPSQNPDAAEKPPR
jgi:rod shape-determining protein MreC